MSDSSDNSTIVEGRARKEPKRLKEIAMMKLIHMLIERFIPHILRSYQDIDSVGGFDAIKKETLAIRDWLYEPLSCSVANDVQELIMKALSQLSDNNGGFMHPTLKYVQLLVLHPKCHNLSLELFFNDMIGDVIEMLQSLIYLEYIKWTGPLPEQETDQFTTNLKYCTRLKIFVHTWYCNDEIIEVLSHNCPLLSVLDVRYSKRVTDVSTHYIKNMKSLRKCYIRWTSITIEGVVSILKNCTQLYKLVMSCDIYVILKSLEDAGNPIQLSLRTVEIHNHLTPRLLKKYCPLLTYVSIIGVERRPESHCHLIGVKRLTIVNPSLRCSALDTWLILENINVITLSIMEISDEDLVELSNGCQNITELYVEVYMNRRNMHSFSEHRPFQKLKILRFKMGWRTRRSRETVDVSIFKILLSYSTMVTHVDIKNLHTDDLTVETVFKTNKMRYLQYWRLEDTVCTSKTFYLLFDMCPMLKFIGNLKTWLIHPDEAEEIENFIRQGNYNLDTDLSDSNALLIRYMCRARELLLEMTHKM